MTGGPTAWHQDHPLWPIIQPADLVSAWVALDDAVIENGCMWMVPGSHKWGIHQRYLSSTKDFKPFHKQPEMLPNNANVEAVPFEIKKGQVGYHHCLTWHGSPHNRSDMKRRAIAVHYMPGHTRYEPIGEHAMLSYVNVSRANCSSATIFPRCTRSKACKSNRPSAVEPSSPLFRRDGGSFLRGSTRTRRSLCA